MRITGIIAEYNPFHNGHLHHVKQARAASGCDAVVAVMSGNFVQRGEPAAFDKWARARMALACGVDAVFELPAFYALQSADWFALGGVAVLDGLGADCLCFGSETPDLEALRMIARLWRDEPEELSTAIREGLRAGKPHPKARAEAIERWLADSGASQAIAGPNAVLGSMYLMQLGALGSAMDPLAVQRVEAGYHDESIAGNIASATAVRKALLAGLAGWRQAVPEPAAAIIDEEIKHGAGPICTNSFSEMLLYALRTGRELPDAAEGLDNRMRNAAFSTGTAEEFYAQAKSKRYTMARVKRAAMQAMLGVTAGDIALNRKQQPVYARLLGYSKRVEGLIGELTRRCTIPLITRASEYMPENRSAARLWEIDRTATDVYALACGDPKMRQGKRDLTEKMIVI